MIDTLFTYHIVNIKHVSLFRNKGVSFIIFTYHIVNTNKDVKSISEAFAG